METCTYCEKERNEKTSCCGEVHFENVPESIKPYDRVIQILASNEVDDGIIDQSLYDFLVEAIRAEYSLKATQAKKSVTSSLKQLYVVSTGGAYG